MGKIGINIATGGLQQNEIIVGIDLGTTNSLVAIIHPDTKLPIALKEHNRSSLVPSLIHFGENQEVTVGESVRGRMLTEPANTIFSVKRLLGKSYKDVKNDASYYSYKIIDDETDRLVKIQVNDRFFTPIELSAFILKELKDSAEHILKTPVNKAVITVPAYFNDAQRQATRDAGKVAGLDVLRIINEPTAASLAYGIGLEKTTSKVIAVYDLGGGTFDISILKIEDGIFEVLSTNGDTFLGGDDFDRSIINYWIKNAGLSMTEVSLNSGLMQQLRLTAEEAKKALSVTSKFEKIVNRELFSLSRETFNDLISPFIARTITCISHALNDAQLSKNDIDDIVMVGGSTRIPLVKKLVSDYFDKPVHDEVNPDEVVALGAAIQADILAGNNKDMLLLDITPLSLGIETMGGLMDVLIPRNSKIPFKVGRQYTTQKDGQSGIRVSVYQGERDLVKDNRKLAEFYLKGIPSMPAGLPKIEVGFLINADGILNVRAKELRTGIESEIEVKSQFGLTDTQVEQMLMDSITNAKEDMKLRALIESKTEARQLIDVTGSFLVKHMDLISAEEIALTKDAILKLENALLGTDKNKIQLLIEELNTITRPFAERIMDIAISKTMKGKKI